MVSYLPIVSDYTYEVLKKYVCCYKERNKDVSPYPVLLAVSLQSGDGSSAVGWLIPFLVYSPSYNADRCFPIFLKCLETSENNCYSLSFVNNSLKAIIYPVENETLPRNSLASHIVSLYIYVFSLISFLRFE